MKITILDPKEGEEEEIIIKSSQLSDDVVRLINSIKTNNNGKITCYKENSIVLLDYEEIIYFESVDQRVFVYTKENVYESKNKLYQLEELLPSRMFLRVNKAAIVNFDMIESLSPAFGGRFEALLKNGYKIIISRMYVPLLKEKLGL